MHHSHSGFCTQCGDIKIVSDAEIGEEVCTHCGLVISEETLNMSPEWRVFTSDENALRARAGKTVSYALYDMGLSTGFRGKRDGRGNHLDVETMRKMNRLRRFDNHAKIYDTWRHNLSIAMVELDRIAYEIHIPVSVKEQAAIIYRKALNHDLIRGRSIDAFVAACLYASCRLHRIPRSLKSICDRSTREPKEISRSYRLLLRELKIRMPIDDPMKFISGIASKLKVKRATERYAVEILRRAKKIKGLSGKDPRGLAAAALYIACVERKEKRKQRVVAAAAETSEVTLRKRIRGLKSCVAFRVSEGDLPTENLHSYDVCKQFVSRGD